MLSTVTYELSKKYADKVVEKATDGVVDKAVDKVMEDVYNKTETYNNTEVYNKTEINNMLVGSSYEEITPSNVVSDSANVFENDVLTTVTKEGYTRNLYFGKSYNETLYLSCIVSDMTVPVAIVASDIGADISDCVVVYASRTGTFNKSISFDMGDLSSGANIYINNAATTSATLYRKITNVDVYNKEETDNLLDLKADKITTYTKTEVDGALSSKANSNDVYTKTQTDTLLSDKADSSNVYTKSDVYNKSETNTLLNNKANSTDVYTKSQTDALLSAKADTSTTYTKAEIDAMIGDALTAEY